MNFKFRIWNGEKYLSLQEALNECIVGFKYNKDNSFELEPYYEDVVFEMSTGLTDKNGAEIYDGDIVKPNYNGLGNIIVKYEDGVYNIAAYLLRECFIVGNIHEVTE